MAVIDPTEFYAHGHIPPFNNAAQGGDKVNVPPLASSLIILIDFQADVPVEVVTHAAADETEAGTQASNESLSPGAGALYEFHVIPARDEFLISSNEQIEFDWLGNYADISFDASYRK